MITAVLLLALAASGSAVAPGATKTCESPICPGNNGCIWMNYNNGAQLQVVCSADYVGGDLETVQAESYTDCLNACAVTYGCVAASYKAPFCYLKNKANQPVSNSAVWGAILYGDAKATPPGSPKGTTYDPKCPNSDNYIYREKKVDFVISCGRDYYGGDLTSVSAAKWDDCLGSCATTTGCKGVSHESRSKTCWLKNDKISGAIYNSEINAARVYT